MKVLFICTANVCRSALAETILKKMLQEKELTDIVVESAGVYNFEGRPRDATMTSLACEAGYEMGGCARYASSEVLASADLIICMEHFHLVEIQKRLPYMHWPRIRRFNDICFGEQSDLADPTGDTDHMYRSVFSQIQKGCEVLASKLWL